LDADRLSDDPSQVDTATLFKSARNDLGLAMARLNEAYRLLQAANATLWELENRAKKNRPAPISASVGQAGPLV
jgi:hypothetical protein